jgi:Uma2 family endonuclease
MLLVMANAARKPIEPSFEPDNRVFLHGVSWDLLEQILESKGESAALRLTYIDGELELMSPSTDHEIIKKFVARLVEAYADELGLDLNGVGSWTIKRPEKKAAAEPDECYVLGPVAGKKKPDLAIEVVWTSGGLDKLDVYQRLGVKEVWVWQKGRIRVFLLAGKRYEPRETSELLPDLDVALVARLATSESQGAAVRELRRIVRGT